MGYTRYGRYPPVGTVQRCLRSVEGVAFWTAALFPVVHLLSLAAVAAGQVSSVELLWPLAGHALALLAGYGYRSPGTTGHSA